MARKRNPEADFQECAAQYNAKSQTATEVAPTEPVPDVEGQRARPDHPDLTWDQRFDAAIADDAIDAQQIDELLEERDRTEAAREAKAARKAPAPTSLPPARESAKDAVKAVADEIATLEAQIADPETSKVDAPALMLQLDQARHTARI